jgi:hypothetical protein
MVYDIWYLEMKNFGSLFEVFDIFWGMWVGMGVGGVAWVIGKWREKGGKSDTPHKSVARGENFSVARGQKKLRDIAMYYTPLESGLNA